METKFKTREEFLNTLECAYLLQPGIKQLFEKFITTQKEQQKQIEDLNK